MTEIKKINKRIVIGALVRDCASTLIGNIKRVEETGELFQDYHVVIFENDSKDETKKILEEWQSHNDKITVISRDYNTTTIPQKSENVPYPAWSTPRIEKMAYYRNCLLKEIEALDAPDYVLFIDLDLYYFSPEGIANAIINAPENWGGLFANGQNWFEKDGKNNVFPTQYDPYAFLEKGKDYRNAASYKFTLQDDYIKGFYMHDILSSVNDKYILCQSAFAGIGIYKYNLIKGRRYTSYVIPEFEGQNISLCEHVPFNCEISAEGADMYIAKDMVTVRELWNEETARMIEKLFKEAFVEKQYRHFENPNKYSDKRYSVLTYNFNDYEVVHEIGEKDPNAEYILVTDNMLQTSDTWKIVYDPELENLSPFDKTFSVRYNCFKYCNTNLCLRIDGSIEVKHSLAPLIDIFEEGNYDACLMPHPFHDNFIDEYTIWIEWRNYPKEQADLCIESMKSKGYDFNYKGMFQGCFSIQRNNETTRNIDKLTFNYLKELGGDNAIERLDQIPFSFIMNTHFSHLKVLPVSEQILRSYYLQWYEHKSEYPNLNEFYNRKEPDERYMFNEKVRCLYLDTPKNYVLDRETDLFNNIRKLCRVCKEKESQVQSLYTALDDNDATFRKELALKDNHIHNLDTIIISNEQSINEQHNHINQQNEVIIKQKKKIKHLKKSLLILSIFTLLSYVIFLLFL